MKIFIIAIISAIVFGTMGFFVAKRVNNPERTIPSEEVLKNSNEAPTTTPAVDANPNILKEEAARKKQRDIDRKQCIADAEAKYAGLQNSKISAYGKSQLSSLTEDIDRCYFRFPTN